MKTIRFELTGTMPLMLNNPQVINPFNEFTKKLTPLTSKKKKTDEDMLQILKLKFLASLYTDAQGRYIVPSEHIFSTLVAAAKERKLGASFIRSAQVIGDSVIKFKDADKTPEQLHELGIYVDVRPVSVGSISKSKVPTARAIIPEWSIETEIWFDENQINLKDIESCMEVAGLRYGIGTYRQKYGRFAVKKLKK